MIVTGVTNTVGGFSGLGFDVPLDATFGDHLISLSVLATSSILHFLVQTDWPMSRDDAAGSGFNGAENVLSPSSLTYPGGLAMQWEYPTIGGAGPGDPAEADGVVYFGDSAGNIYAVNASTGTKLWTVNPTVTSAHIHSAPGVDGTMLFVPDDGSMVALATANGKVKWTVETGGAGLATPVSSPLVSSNTVYFSGWDGTANTLYSVNETSGAINWTRELSTNELWGTPALSSADVYLGDYSGTMYAVKRSNGKIDWHHAVGGHPRAEPAVVNGSVYLTTGQDTWSLSETTGLKNWAAPFDGMTSPAVQGAQVILSEFANDGVGAASLAAGTGVPSWSITTGNGSNFSQTSPAVADGVVYLVGADELWRLTRQPAACCGTRISSATGRS